MVGSVLAIAGGTALAAYGEVHNSVVGVFIMLLSEVCEAVRLVMTQMLLQGLHMGPFEGVMWMVRRQEPCARDVPSDACGAVLCVLYACSLRGALPQHRQRRQIGRAHV